MWELFYKLICKIAIRYGYEKWYRFALRKRLRNADFTIISNNCWGGSVMEDLGLQYNSPTIGFYFFAPCYISFLRNIKSNLELPLTFLKESKYPFANEQRELKWYPICQIGESELHFVHDQTEQEAYDKWDRRRVRVNFDNLFVAFSDRDQCTNELIKEFDNMPFKNKVFFSSKIIKGINSLVWLKEYQNEDYIGDLYNNRWSYRKYFDLADWLNYGRIK
jgi:uncharacterized protein (DUF1919 family)